VGLFVLGWGLENQRWVEGWDRDRYLSLMSGWGQCHPCTSKLPRNKNMEEEIPGQKVATNERRGCF